jgi:hypothetical protein
VKQHPISRMAERLVSGWPDYAVNQLTFAEKQIARSVKPLLDALDIEHHTRWGATGCKMPDTCEVCRLLAEWRRPL